MARLPTEDGLSAEQVEQVMTRRPITVRPDAELADAARVMADFRRKSLPVTDDGRVVGMISRADVVRQLAGTIDRSPPRSTNGRGKTPMTG